VKRNRLRELAELHRDSVLDTRDFEYRIATKCFSKAKREYSNNVAILFIS
jgi:hypothetical protein